MLLDEATGLVFCIQRDAAASRRPWRVDLSVTYGPPVDDSSPRGSATSWSAHLFAGPLVRPLTFHDLLEIQADLTVGDQIAARRGPLSAGTAEPPPRE